MTTRYFFLLHFIIYYSINLSASYVDWTITTGSTGTGTLGGKLGFPDFTFAITGDVQNDETEIDGNDTFDHGPWETLFGEGDNQQSLRFRSSGTGLTISNLTIDFSSTVAPSTNWAFAVTDLEGEDAVINASFMGNQIPKSEISSWFQGLFDSRPNTDGSNLPSGFDSENLAVVAEFDQDGLLSDEIFSLSGTESASAWFSPDVPVDQLTISHRNRFGGSASMHVYIAATSQTIPEPSTFKLMLLTGFFLGIFLLKKIQL